MSGKGEILFQIDNLCKAFGSNLVLDHISTEIKSGEVVVIVGPSGSGKSTFLRSLNLLEMPTSGTITFEGMNITDKKTDINKYRQKIGMVFQHFNLFANLNVIQNIMLAPVELKKMTKGEARARGMELLEMVGLAEKAEVFPSKLSGGQKQRCACARAIINKPRLILADEPTGALDSHSSQMLLSTMQSINGQLGATILMVTHDAFSASYANRILFLRDGVIFTEILKGQDSRKVFFEKILDVLTMMGGGQTNV